MNAHHVGRLRFPKQVERPHHTIFIHWIRLHIRISSTTFVNASGGSTSEYTRYCKLVNSKVQNLDISGRVRLSQGLLRLGSHVFIGSVEPKMVVENTISNESHLEVCGRFHALELRKALCVDIATRRLTPMFRLSLLLKPVESMFISSNHTNSRRTSHRTHNTPVRTGLRFDRVYNGVAARSYTVNIQHSVDSLVLLIPVVRTSRLSCKLLTLLQILEKNYDKAYILVCSVDPGASTSLSLL